MFEFLRHEFGAAEKNRKKVEANCTGFSAVLWSVEMFCFEFETIYVKTSRNMSNPMKIQLSFFG